MSTLNVERAISNLKQQIDAPVATFLSSCVNCGICAEACHFYTENHDPSYTPINKIKPLKKVWQQEFTLVGRLMRLLGLSKPLTDEELKKLIKPIYHACSLCGRCSMVCPLGLDITDMIRKTREGMVASGNVPKDLIAAATRTVKIGSPMGVTLHALKAQVKHIEKNTESEVLFDKQGAEYMVLLSSMEIMNYPEYLEAIIQIFKKAGKTWTISSKAFEATNTGIQIGSSDIARDVVSKVVEAAEELKVKTVISPECGHAYTAIRWEGPNLMGRKFNFKVRHILEVLDEFREQGILKTSGKKQQRLTFHDPCQLVRRGGVIKQPRNLINMVSENFVEMEDAGRDNWCCGAGGGVSAIEDANEIKMKAFKHKVKQVKDTNCEMLVTACANCRIQIEDGFEEYDIDLPVLGVTEMIAEYLHDDS
jgi:Fe-S oxidoreductase